MGTQLIQPAGSSVNSVIRTTVAQANQPALIPSTTSTRQILLPTGQTVIPRQNGNPQAGFSKNVLVRHSGIQPVIVRFSFLFVLIGDNFGIYLSRIILICLSVFKRVFSCIQAFIYFYNGWLSDLSTVYFLFSYNSYYPYSFFFLSHFYCVLYCNLFP